MPNLTRRGFVATATATALGAPTLTVLTSPARAATTYKLATNLPSGHPMLLRLQEAADAIKTDTNGELEMRFFPNSQLGGDLEGLSQLRSGAVQFYTLAGAQLSTFVPVASLNNVGFAFNSRDEVWKAMDGDVGALIRNALQDAGLFVFDRAFDNGFRQITTSKAPVVTPADLKGLPIRVPPSPLSTSLFRALGAAPQSISYGELYTALQTHVVDAEENPLPLIDTSKFYEVQKYVSMTNHSWDGFWVMANRTAWNRLPAATRDIVQKHFTAAALAERDDVAKLDAGLVDQLKKAGMTFIEPDRSAFRTALNSTGFYKDCKAQFHDKAWATLEKYTGQLG
jgi:tripartite ATP-independent transporter DctP family solute receptor